MNVHVDVKLSGLEAPMRALARTLCVKVRLTAAGPAPVPAAALYTFVAVPALVPSAAVGYETELVGSEQFPDAATTDAAETQGAGSELP